MRFPAPKLVFALFAVLLLLSTASTGESRGVTAKLRQTALYGRGRVGQLAHTVAHQVGAAISARGLQSFPPAVCSSAPNEGCCPIAQQLAALGDSDGCPAGTAQNLPTAGSTPPALSNTQLAMICSSRCLASVNNIVAGLPSVTDTTGCADVAAVKSGADITCMTDDEGDYCYHTARAIVILKQKSMSAPGNVSTAAWTRLLCSACGERLVRYFAHLPLIEKQSLNLDNYSPSNTAALPFLCARDPDSGDLCFSGDSDAPSSNDPCSACGRAAFRVGAADLGFDDQAMPLLNCGCAEQSESNRTCFAVYHDSHVKLDGTGIVPTQQSQEVVLTPPICVAESMSCNCLCAGDIFLQCAGDVTADGTLPAESCQARSPCGAPICSNVSTPNDVVPLCTSPVDGCNCGCNITTNCTEAAAASPSASPIPSPNTSGNDEGVVLPSCNLTMVCKTNVPCEGGWCNAAACVTETFANVSCAYVVGSCEGNVSFIAVASPTPLPSPIPASGCAEYTTCDCICPREVTASCAFWGNANDTTPEQACNFTSPCGMVQNCVPASGPSFPDNTVTCDASMDGCSCSCVTASNCSTVAVISPSPVASPLVQPSAESSADESGDEGSIVAGFRPVILQNCSASAACSAVTSCADSFCNSTGLDCGFNGTVDTIGRCTLTQLSCSEPTVIPTPTHAPLVLVNSTMSCSCSCPRNMSVVCNGTTVGNDTLTSCAVAATCDETRICDVVSGNAADCTSLQDCNCNCDVVETCVTGANGDVCRPAILPSPMPPLVPSPVPVAKCANLIARCDVSTTCSDRDITFCNTSTVVVTPPCAALAQCTFDLAACAEASTGFDSDSESEDSGTASVSPSAAPSPSAGPIVFPDNPDLRSCLDLIRGAVTTCSADCAANVHSLLNDTGCCSSCIIIGFNATYANFSLPPMDTTLLRLSQCSSVNVSDFDTCSEPVLVQEILTIDNLKFSYVSPQQDFVRSCVADAVAEAAAVDLSSVTVTDASDTGSGVSFNVSIASASTTHANLIAESLWVVSARNLMNLSCIESEAFGNLSVALYNQSEPLVTHIVSNAGSAVATFSSLALFALMAAVAALLM